MESLIIWFAILGVATAIVGRYVVQFLRRREHDRQRLRLTRELGLDRPSGQYPQIAASECIGCGTCVAACPEGDVLGIVMGKSVVVNGARCIGHGRCGEVCPVGAIKIGFGDTSQRDDIPLLDEHNQTSVPGIWIAGELSGFALISNAVAQGQRVAERIAAAADGRAEPGRYDVVIVGAGPAGMSTALALRQSGLSAIILDQQGAGGTILQYPRHKLVMVQPVEIPGYGRLSRLEYSKEELLGIWEELHTAAGLDIRIGIRATGVTGSAGDFTVHTTNGHWPCRHVVLALGRRGTPRRLNVPGEDLAKVAYRLIDAEAYPARRVLVVGGGDSAVEAAMGLAHQDRCEVTLSYRKPELMRIKQRNQERVGPMIDSGKIAFLGGTTVTAIHPTNCVLDGPRGSLNIPNDDVFILAGGIPPFSLLREAGVRFGGDKPAVAPRPPAPPETLTNRALVPAE